MTRAATPGTGRGQPLAHDPGHGAIWAPLAIYIVLSVSFFGLDRSFYGSYFGFGNDPFQYIWVLRWVPYAISHELNPLTTNHIWYPHGLNLTWQTSVLSAAFLALPLTLTGGPILAFNVLTLLAPALSAWTGFLLARHLTRDWAASLVAGYLFGFSSYELGQLMGHMNLDITFVIPLVVLLCVRRFAGDISRSLFVGLLAVAVATQLGFSTELLATLVMMGAITWAIFLAFAPARDRRRFWLLALDIALAGMVACLLAAPFIYYLVKGLRHRPGGFAFPQQYSADLLNFVVPTPLTLFGGTLFSAVAGKFTGNILEQGAYLGLPLLAVLFHYFVRRRAPPYRKAFLATVAAFVILSLGPRIQIGGVRTSIRLPWAIAEHLPLIRDALPARFTMYVALSAAMVAALWLSEARNAARWRRFALAGAACLFLAPNPAAMPWTRWPGLPFFTTAHVRKVLGPHPNVIILPYAYTGPGMAWQLDTGLGLTQSGGYLTFMPSEEWRWPVVQALYDGNPSAMFRDDLISYCVSHQVDFILTGPGTPPRLQTAISALGWQEVQDGRVGVVRVPPASSLDYVAVTGNYWPTPEPETWMGRHVRIATHGQAELLRLTGRYRPPQLGPVTITVTQDGHREVYAMGRSDTVSLPLPANDSMVIAASSTFIPSRILHNHDGRRVSVVLAIAKLK